MKTLSMILVLAMFSPVSLLAQVVSTELQVEPIVETAVTENLQPEVVILPQPPVEEIAPVSSEIAGTEPVIEIPQDTTSTQEAIQGQVLEETLNPQEENVQPEATTTTEVIIEGSENQVPISQSLDDSTQPIQPVQQIQTIPVQVTITQVMQVDQIEKEELKPKQEYTLALDGGALTTIEEVKDGKDKKVTEVPQTSLDVEARTLTVSGSCDDPYYVVLIYKDEKDYSDNRSSYIFNKAFDCINGQYSYPVSELPPDLGDGRYYLLVGGQGNEGTWKPISAMVPITINKKDE